MSRAGSTWRHGGVQPRGLRMVRSDDAPDVERRAGAPVQGRTGAPAPSLSPLHKRLLIAAGDHSARELARLTGCHPETVRRYLCGRQPSVEFVIAFSEALGVRIDWLLLGHGPRFPDELINWAARSPDFPNLVRRAYNAHPDGEPRPSG